VTDLRPGPSARLCASERSVTLHRRTFEPRTDQRL